jgi:hypothetical protein
MKNKLQQQFGNHKLDFADFPGRRRLTYHISLDRQIHTARHLTDYRLSALEGKQEWHPFS